MPHPSDYSRYAARLGGEHSAGERGQHERMLRELAGYECDELTCAAPVIMARRSERG